MKHHETYANVPAEVLAAGLVEIHDLLAGLSRGDMTLRAEVKPEGDIFSGIKKLINQLAKHIQQTNDYSHEMAIGLCEHYETLNRIAKGDFSGRAAVTSEIEVVAKLGELINLETNTLTTALSRAQQAEEDKQAQLQFMRVLLDTIPNPVFYKDANGRYLGCNKAFETYVGLSQDDLIGKSPHEFWPEELADRYLQQDLELLGNPGFQGYEASVRYADGSLRDVIFNKATFSGSDGLVAGLVGVVLDITERKAAEEETKNAYQRLWEIVEFLPDATFVVDKEKRVIAWNRAIEKMTGLEKHEVLGKGDFVYAIPFYGVRRPILIDLIDENQAVVSQNYKYIKKEGRTLYTEVLVPSLHGGDSRFLWATATPLFDKGGNQVGGIESIRDITAYKQAEHEKSRLESQLLQTRMMESVVKRLGHDLKTPLTPLFVMLTLLKKRITDPDLIKMVEMCLKSATSINNLADKTRVLATLSSDIKPYEREGIDLASLVNRALDGCADMIFCKQIDCRNVIDRAVIVHGVEDQLRELFVNLISNAVRFSDEKGSIVISVGQQDEVVTISVQDHGVGLAPDHLERVFDEFFKADESRHDIDATGLGLSICKRIVQNHHGRIWAESPGRGKGTTIKFTVNGHCSDLHLQVA